MILRPQDVAVTLGLVVLGDRPWIQSDLGRNLRISQSEVAKSLKRGLGARLLVPGHDDRRRPRPARKALLEFLAHGVQYAFPPDRGGLTRGLRTAHAAPPLAGEIAAGDAPPPVWPWAEGDTRGESFSLLYPGAPAAARQNAEFYELLVLVDALRGGRARERAIALKHLKRRLKA